MFLISSPLQAMAGQTQSDGTVILTNEKFTLATQSETELSKQALSEPSVKEIK